MNLNRTALVAKREFLVTVTSKGFLIGVLMMPVLMLILITLIPRILNQRGAAVEVQVGLLDRSGVFAGPLQAEMTPDAIEARLEARRRATEQQLGAAGEQVAAVAAPASTATYQLRDLPDAADVESQKAWLTESAGEAVRRVLLVIPAGSINRPDSGVYESYELYSMRNLPEDAEDTLHGGIRQALIASRLRSDGFDPELVRAATTIARPKSVVVSADGRQQGAQGLNRALPFIMGILLFIGVMTGGQSLMTSTVEEKSSRVVEVLLAAVSPLELMWGKLLGQLGVGLVTLGIYVGMGVFGLLQFAMFGLVDPLLILYLFLFFLVTYLVFGALMQAIGAAVSQMADAQSLMGPIMLLLLIPYILSPVIGRAPDSAIAVVASFVPPVNSFAMLARLASSSPPPVWQVLLSLLCGIVGAIIAVWFAAKVFRVGLLMHGKPPSFATLIKWARMS